MIALNLQVRTMHAPYVRSFSGFGRPWNHLEKMIEDIDVREAALGSGYIVTGHVGDLAAFPVAPAHRGE